jgi:protein SSD1
VAPEYEVSSIETDIRLLYELTKVLRTRRFQNGSHRLDAPRLSFKLNDRGLPVDCPQIVNLEANSLVEEVAQQIAVALPEQALLRRHDSPIDRRLVGQSGTTYFPKLII